MPWNCCHLPDTAGSAADCIALRCSLFLVMALHCPCPPPPPHQHYSVTTRILRADSKKMRNTGKLQLGAVLAEYGLVAKTLAAEHEGKSTAGKVFFTKVEFESAKDLFGRCGQRGAAGLAQKQDSIQ